MEVDWKEAVRYALIFFVIAYLCVKTGGIVLTLLRTVIMPWVGGG